MQSSIIEYSNLEKTSLRLDAEYYKPEYLTLYNKLIQIPNSQISEFSYVTDGIHNSIKFNNDSNIRLLSAKAPKENYFDLSNIGKIDEQQDSENPRTRLKVNDVIVSTVGTIGNCAVIDESILPANCDRDIGIIRIEKDFQPRFLSTFLLSKYGRFQTLRSSTGNVQLHLFIYKINEIIVPRFSDEFQYLIEKIVLKASSLLQSSKAYYTQAEHLLLTGLGLVNWSPKQQLSFVKNFSDTQDSERIDAEYFQPKYDEIVNAVKSYEGGWDTLGNLVNIKNKNFKPKDNVVYQYIELANIGSNGEVKDSTEELGTKLPTRARRIVSTGDVIVSSIEGSLSSVALITEEFNDALCSTGFYVINSKFYNSETLLCLAKSIVGQMQLKKGCNGTILTSINKDEFSKIILPKISYQIQQAIEDKISLVYETRAKSKHLLEIAKRGVEMAIEQDEEAAEEWIKMRVNCYAKEE